MRIKLPNENQSALKGVNLSLSIESGIASLEKYISRSAVY